MEVKDVRLLFTNGALAAARIDPYPMKEEIHMLTVTLASGEEKPITRVRSKETKMYRSLKEIKRDLKAIGLRKAEWNF